MRELNREQKILSLVRLLASRERGDAPGWQRDSRQKALELLEEKGLPTRKWESWKYISLVSLVEAEYETSEVPAALTEEEEACVEKAGSRTPLIFKNGLWSNPDAFSLNGHGFKAVPLSGEPHAPGGINQDPAREENPFALLNTAGFEDGAVIRVSRDTVLRESLGAWFFTEQTGDAPLLAMPKLTIVVEAGAKAGLVCRWPENPRANTFTNANIDVRLEPNASLDLLYIQTPGPAQNLFVNTRAVLAEGSRLESMVFNRGGKAVRNDLKVEFEGPNASCALNGLSILSGRSQAFHEVKALHAVPDCASSQFYKNILDEQAIAEFNSLAYVYRDARRSNSEQLNKNLLLSDNARAYSRPQLKIYNDDVSANHGSANGEVAGHELFYLQSRGLDKKLARFVLTYGFAEEILQKIKNPQVRQELEQYVYGELQKLLET